MQHLYAFGVTRGVLIGIATLVAIGDTGVTPGVTPISDPSRNMTLEEGYGTLPLAFEINRGQFDASVRFLARGPDYALFLTATEAVLDLEGTVLRMRLAGANPTAAIAGLDPLPGHSNYYKTNLTRPTAGRRSGPRGLFEGGTGERYENIPSYAKVRYADVYPGVDLVYYGNQRQLEYDLVVAPGADPNVIRLTFEGAARMEIGPEGDLVLQVAGGEIRQHKPVLYQEVDGVRQHVDGGYGVAPSQQAAFSVGVYDRSKPLIIDPVLSYGTFLGGNDWDSAEAIAVDAAGSAYVTGQTRSTDFPLSAGHTPVVAGRDALFVTKLNAAGTAFLYSTYFDEAGSYNVGKGIKVDAAGNAYVTGQFAPGNSALIMRLDASGVFTYGVVMGNGGNNWGNGIAIDAAGNAYVTGQAGPSFDVTVGASQTASGGGDDAFVAKLDTNGASDGSSLIYSTFLGGSADDEGVAIAIDGSGNAYVTGETFLGSFPATAGGFQPTAGGGFSDAFLSKLSPSGQTLLYSTYFGGSFAEYGKAIAVDAAGNAYIAGIAQSSGLPTTTGAYQETWTMSDCRVNAIDAPKTCDDAFVAKFKPSASGSASLVYSTYLGSTGSDRAYGLAIDGAGHAYVTGYTVTAPYTPDGDFPTVNPIAGFNIGNSEGFITELNAAGSALLFSTYYTGRPWGLALDASGNLYVAGSTYSTSGIATSGVYQGANRGGLEAFIAKFSGFPAVPMAVNDSYTASANTTSTVAAPGVLSNDATNGGGAMTASLVSSPTSGALTLNADGSFTYTPAAGFTGVVTFTYRADNTVGSGTTATVTITVAVPTVLRPPTNLRATSIAGNTVTIAFTAPLDSITPTSYVLEGGISPGLVLASVPTGSVATSFMFTAPDGAFYIRVRSVAGVQKSGASNEIRIFVNVPTPPSAPANLLALVNGSSLTLAWMNTAAGGAPTRLLVDVSGSLTTTVSMPVGETASFPFVPAGNYTLALRAENGAGTSAPSNGVTVAIPGACSGTPGTPTNFAVTKSGNVISASWHLPATGPAPTAYSLLVTGAFAGSFPVTARSISGAVGPGSYALTVASTNACGTSAATAAQSVTIP